MSKRLEHEFDVGSDGLLYCITEDLLSDYCEDEDRCSNECVCNFDPDQREALENAGVLGPHGWMEANAPLSTEVPPAIYKGYRIGGHARVVVEVPSTGGVEPLRHVCKHSPDGFEWGYGGSGPSDLALSILTDFMRRYGGPLLGHTLPPSVYQPFKWDVVAKFEKGQWTLADIDVITWLRINIRGLPLHRMGD